MGEPVHLDLGAQQLEHRLDVDLGRLQQDLAERPAEPLVLEADPASAERASVNPFECRPEEGSPITTSPGATAEPSTIASRATVPKQAPETSTPWTMSPSWASSPPGISIPASVAPRASPIPICSQTSGLARSIAM